MASIAPPISNLAPSPGVVVAETVAVVTPAKQGCNNNWASLIVWFLVIAVIVWFILYATKPCCIRKKDARGLPCDDVDWCRLLGAAVVIAIILLIIIWLIRAGLQC